jgi:hypothetical protein
MLLTWFALTASLAALTATVVRAPRAIPIRVRTRRVVRVVRRD